MDWLKQIFADPTSVESTLLILALVIALGLAIGSVSVRGVRFGVAGILFVGLAFAHFGWTPNAAVLSFSREFGLVLFVFAVGLRVGPGFFNALRRRGLALNVMASGVVLLGLLVTILSMLLIGVTGPIAVGLFSGATTNTPSLAAAGQALRDFPPASIDAQNALAQALPDHPLVRESDAISDANRSELLAEVSKLPAMAYAISYPGGVFGIIAAIIFLRWVFKVDLAAEAKAFDEQQLIETPPLTNVHIKVTNANLVGMPIAKIPAIESLGVVISRIMRGPDETVAHEQFELMTNDVLMVVGHSNKLREFATIVGEQVTVAPSSSQSQIQVRWIFVSRMDIADKTIEETSLNRRFGVQVTRIRRSGVELPPLRNMHLHLGDEVRVVGPPRNIAQVASALGDSRKRLDEPELLPIFVGITLGIIVGSIPFSIPGFTGNIKLGLAGGPLIVAILLSRIHRIGPLVWYVPRSANLALRDIGIAVFLASVGLKSGDMLVDALTHGSGLLWLAIGSLITFVPLIIVATIAYYFVHEQYLTIIGMLAGSMTDPPALAFANSMTGSEIPNIAYATVYPLTMILRIISAQLLVTYWAS
jgi:putative transport protein